MPDQLAIGGFNDLPACASTVPALTSVVTPRFEIGEQSATMLVDLIEGRAVAKPRADLGIELSSDKARSASAASAIVATTL